jgi:hypothetical protein
VLAFQENAGGNKASPLEASPKLFTRFTVTTNNANTFTLIADYRLSISKPRRAERK